MVGVEIWDVGQLRVGVDLHGVLTKTMDGARDSRRPPRAFQNVTYLKPAARVSGGDQGVQEHKARPPASCGGEAADKPRALALGGRSCGKGVELVCDSLVSFEWTSFNAVEAAD